MFVNSGRLWSCLLFRYSGAESVLSYLQTHPSSPALSSALLPAYVTTQIGRSTSVPLGSYGSKNYCSSSGPFWFQELYLLLVIALFSEQSFISYGTCKTICFAWYLSNPPFLPLPSADHCPPGLWLFSLAPSSQSFLTVLAPVPSHEFPNVGHSEDLMWRKQLL